MSFITKLALSRRPVTILTVILVFGLSIYAYNGLQRELFPEIEFPNIVIVALYPNSDPETVADEVTEPIENSISGMTGLNQLESVSGSDFATVLATFDFDTDMDEAQRDIESAISGIDLPDNVDTPSVSRINSDTFPIMQFTISSDGDVSSLHRLVEDVLVPRIEGVDGVGAVNTLGIIVEEVMVTVDADKLDDLSISSQQVADAIAANNVSFPAGSINTRGTNYPVRTASKLGSLQDIRDLNVAQELTDTGVGDRFILVSDVAEVELVSNAWPISRTNGKPSVTITVIKEPDANTIEVADAVLASIDEGRASRALPPEIEILTMSNDAPYLEEVLDSLLEQGMQGFAFAVAVVFLFLLNVRPSLRRGIALSIRPTVIIGISIPLSVLTGVLMMSFTDITLNFMSLSGLAIAVGRVVDDSIVVLENIYRHIQQGENRIEAAYEATREVGAAIVSSTLTTVAIFVPLAFISGIVGEFFSPFAISVSLALIASTFVALTAVPVLGAILLRREDFPEGAMSDGEQDTLMQRTYLALMRWTLNHKFLTLLAVALITFGSLGLVRFIPITFFPADTPEYLTIDLELTTGVSVDRTNEVALTVEDALERLRQQGIIEIYQVTLGQSAAGGEGGLGGSSIGSHLAGFFVALEDDVPDDVEALVRAAMPEVRDDVSLTVNAIEGGPPSGGLEMTVTGANFNDIADVSDRLEEQLAQIDSVINVGSTVSEGQDEVVINVDPKRAGEYLLSGAAVGAQVSQFTVGREISEINRGGRTSDVFLRGDPDDVDDIDKLQNLKIQGPVGSVKLGVIADIGIEKAPISISRYDSDRSATITGTITAEDTQRVGLQVDEVVQNVDLPPGVTVETGGIFEQINEGFQDVYVAMITGVVLVYLVMVATLGALRTPFVIVLSLPLAISGALLALLITGRTLSLSAMMGFLLLIGIVVTNAIVLLTFVEQLRSQGYSVYDALLESGRIRLRPILMTAFTTTFALLPLAVSPSDVGLIGAELATVVIGGLISSTFLTLVVVPVVYTIANVSIPGLFSRRPFRRSARPEVGVAD